MRKKHLILTLAFVMILVSGITAFGDGLIFTDINDHWAKEYIEDIYNRKLTSGYVDATYRPNNPIVGLEAVVMLANLLGFDAEEDAATDLQVDKFTMNRIPAWAYGHLAYLMDRNIVKETELSNFVKDNKTTKIKRYEFANLIGRILVEYGGEDVSRSYLLPYKDEMDIPATTKPYVDLMLRKNLLNAASNDGRFLPENEITRGEVAKIISLTAELLDDIDEEIIEAMEDSEEENNELEEENDDLEEVEEAEEENNEVEDKITYQEGVIDGLTIGNRRVITITSDENLLIYDISDTALVYLDNDKKKLSDLIKGQDVKLKLVNDVVVRIDAVAMREVYRGYFEKLTKGTSNTVLSLVDDKEKLKVYRLPNDITVYLNGERSNLESFKVGDIVKVFAKDDELTEIQGKSKTEFVRGVITSLGTSNNQVVEIAKNDDTIIQLEMEDETVIRRDGRVASFSKLRVSDEVHIELEYDKVKVFNASTVRRRVEGYIRKIVIGEESYVVIESSDNVKEEFLIEDYTTIRMGDDAGEIYDLRLNYFAEVKIESNEVVRLTTTDRLDMERVNGIITYIDEDAEVFEVEYIEDGKAEVKMIHTKDNGSNDRTVYIDDRGTTRFSKLQVGDEIFVVGQTKKGIFTAERVVIVVSD
ncbi:S-layer homology domain-containing protein [Alkaliphilus pronyensis]|uniref:S-layer homology domain-containing protein n=1 Tax=Alkaliphilus pronyensis TaxID=1482732 RepID=A0A6I0F187_9FIRM|nr:S-layer homology domain-containing protein [Alkaliphilus pronyensis]KAB3534712.1 S-layer homology domain-containing protein [Alkaliphilus pronyensis]